MVALPHSSCSEIAGTRFGVPYPSITWPSNILTDISTSVRSKLGRSKRFSNKKRCVPLLVQLCRESTLLENVVIPEKVVPSM